MMVDERIEALLNKGVEAGVYPGAVLVTARGGMPPIFHAVGSRMLAPSERPMEKGTRFDLASLTKPLATTLAVMKLVDMGKMGLDQPLEALLPKAVPEDKKTITPRRLLSHSAGLVDWLPFYLQLDRVALEERKSLIREALLNLPLRYTPGTRTLYSDLGFMLLEWVIEAVAGVDLPQFMAQICFLPLTLKETGLFGGDIPDPSVRGRFAATEDCPWRKQIVQGRVHDENAYALGGYSGHAGLFGTAAEVYILANLLIEHWRRERSDFLRPETVRTFFQRQKRVQGGTWALGWDTPSLENSSAGKYFSPRSVGHLGFTGTSIWMDLEQDVVVILLTNRIHPTRKNEKIRAFRPLLHDSVMEAFGLTQRFRG